MNATIQAMTKLMNILLGALLAGLFCGADALPQQPAPAAGTPAPAAAAPSGKSATSGQASATAKTGQAAGIKKPAAAAAPLTTDLQKASYAIGQNIGKGLHQDGVDVDTTTLMRGVRDGLSGAKPALTDEEAKAALTKLAAKDPAKAKLVELRYFAGLTGDQAADVLGISPTTADRHWAYARAWLRAEVLGGDGC